MKALHAKSLAALVALPLLACSSKPNDASDSTGNGQMYGSGGSSGAFTNSSSGGFTSENGGTDTAGASAVESGGFRGSGGITSGDGSTPTNEVDGGSSDSYVNLAPPLLAALDPNGGTTLNPPPPDGWNWYPIADAQCRDGSPMGIYVRFGTVSKLMVYLEGGGACTDAGFCNYNPANVASAISGTGETVIGSAFGVGPSRQQPGVYTGGVPQGIFDETNTQNPYKGWSKVYVPYCTGDVHFGSNPSSTVPGLATPQHFVGYLNMQKIVGHLVPTFRSKIERVILTGASAGSFGAALNVSMVQDAFGSVPVDLVLDSGLPFTDKYMFACMQKTWRTLWGLDKSLPSDCKECFQADGGGMVHLADFELKKHPKVKLAAISAEQDEVIRLFFSMGLKECATITSADPVGITLGQFDPTVYYPGPDYTSALNEMKASYASTNRLAMYLIGGANITVHQHTFRSRFYDTLSGGKSPAQFVSDFLDGKVEQITPE